MILTPYSMGFKTTVGKNSFPLEVMLCARRGNGTFSTSLLCKLRWRHCASGRLELEALSPFHSQVTLLAKSLKLSLQDFAAFIFGSFIMMPFAFDTWGKSNGNTPFRAVFFQMTFNTSIVWCLIKPSMWHLGTTSKFSIITCIFPTDWTLNAPEGLCVKSLDVLSLVLLGSGGNL